MPSETLRGAGFLQRVGAQVAQAKVATTCDAGKEGSHIDYGLCSASRAPLLAGMWATAAVPWKTHCGLVVEFRAGHE
eukprot:331434-Pyramimonas_sp.AAC.1